MKKYLFAIIFSLFFLPACQDLLDVEPTHAVDLDVVVSSYTSLQGVLIDTYDDFQAAGLWGSNFTVMPEVMADNFEYLHVTGNYESHYFNYFRTHIYAWVYELVNQTNVVITYAEQIRGEAGVTDAEVDNLVGQAHALRAILYFYMVNVYAYTPTAVVESRDRGGVPLILHPVTDLSDITYPERASIAAVYTQIVEDLKTAINLLDDEYALVHQTGFIGRAAAQAFLSRVALFRGDWPETVAAATDAINAGVAELSSRESYGTDWEATVHRESFFTLIYEAFDGSSICPRLLYNTLDKNDPGFSGHGEYVISEGYLGLLLEKDVRWAAMQMGTQDRLETTKFMGQSEAAWGSNILMIRLSEVYLNRAEAYAHLNLDNEAIADLDLLRQRSLGPDFTPTTATGPGLLDSILLERRLELAFEGLRWFDLKRLGMDVDKSQLTGEIIDFETDPRILAPVPQNEMDLNPNMVQNEGY